MAINIIEEAADLAQKMQINSSPKRSLGLKGMEIMN
jgi:hypothetical protein